MFTTGDNQFRLFCVSSVKRWYEKLGRTGTNKRAMVLTQSITGYPGRQFQRRNEDT
jgi:hypothetical protein